MPSSLRNACLAAMLLLPPAAVQAQPSDAAVARFNACAAIREDAERLRCFDTVTRAVRAEAQAAPRSTTPSRPAQTAQTRARSERENFGLNATRQRQRRGEAPQIKNLTAKVAATREFGAGYWMILLDDGAIWEVTELRSMFEPPRRGDTIRIRRGAIGGYLLYVGRQASINARRVS